MTSKEINSSINGSANEISNAINSNNITININGDTVKLTLNSRIVLRELYEDLIKSGGQAHMFGPSLNQDFADKLPMSLEDLNHTKSILYAKKLIEDKTIGGWRIKLTDLGQKIGEHYAENFPKEYDQERTRIIQQFIRCAKTDKDDSKGYKISLNTEYTIRVVQELEDEVLLAQYSRGGIIENTYIDSSMMRCLTPNFRSKFKNEIEIK